MHVYFFSYVHFPFSKWHLIVLIQVLRLELPLSNPFRFGLLQSVSLQATEWLAGEL